MSETPAPDYQVDGLDLRHVQLALDDWGKLRDLYGLFQQGRVLAQDGVHWYNTQRLLEPIGNVPPVEYEMNYYRSQEGSLEGACAVCCW